MTRLIKFMPLTVLALMMGVLAYALLKPPTIENDPFANRSLPELPLRQFSDSPGFDLNQIEGPYLLNFWASWCAPCRIEHPHFMVMAEQGIPIYGIVYKDEPADANVFLDQLGNPFLALMADTDGDAGFELGVTGPPETILVNADGTIRARWRGAITDITWDSVLAPVWDDMGGQEVEWPSDPHTP